MNELNEFIADLLNNFSLSTVTDRSWFEIALILAPSVILILTLFGFSFTLQKKKLENRYLYCLPFTHFAFFTLRIIPPIYCHIQGPGKYW